MKRAGRGALTSLAVAWLGACDLSYPEVVVVNRTSEAVQLQQVSFNGCQWEGVLAFGEATPVGRCLPGSGRVHFQKHDAADWARQQEGADLAEPLWFAYQTTTERSAGSGSFHVFEITLDGVEQDFSVPGPYGH